MKERKQLADDFDNNTPRDWTEFDSSDAFLLAFQRATENLIRQFAEAKKE